MRLRRVLALYTSWQWKLRVGEHATTDSSSRGVLTKISKVFETLSVIMSRLVVVAIVASLHSEKDARVGTVKVVVVQVLHHQEGPPVVLVGRHHELLVQVHGGLILQGIGEQVCSQTVVHLLGNQTIVRVDTCQ